MFDLDPIFDVLLGFSLGLLALVIGAVGLLVRGVRTGTIGWPLPLALGVLLAGPALGLALSVSTHFSSLALGLLSGFFALLALARMSINPFGNRVASRFLRQGWVPSTSLALLGLGLISWHVFALERERVRELGSGDTTLSHRVPPEFEPIPGKFVETDKGRRLQLMRLVHVQEADDEEEATYLRSLGLDHHLIQTGPRDDSYNCHGWVFADSKGWILGESVDSILEDNQYHTISKPQLGDVVLFRNSVRKVTHSSIVRAVLDDGTILIESKWGFLGRYTHTLEQHAYRSHQPVFYRSTRMGHRLHEARTR